MTDGISVRLVESIDKMTQQLRGIDSTLTLILFALLFVGFGVCTRV